MVTDVEHARRDWRPLRGHRGSRGNQRIHRLLVAEDAVALKARVEDLRIANEIGRKT